jgi:E3 ubiquitin-protein transferase RMND5
MAMTTLQNPIKSRLEAITDDLKLVTKAQRSFGKALDKVRSIRPAAGEHDGHYD